MRGSAWHTCHLHPKLKQKAEAEESFSPLRGTPATQDGNQVHEEAICFACI